MSTPPVRWSARCYEAERQSTERLQNRDDRPWPDTPKTSHEWPNCLQGEVLPGRKRPKIVPGLTCGAIRPKTGFCDAEPTLCKWMTQADVVAATPNRAFPAIVGPHKEDICYATTTAQRGGQGNLAPKCDGRCLVVGAPKFVELQTAGRSRGAGGLRLCPLVQRANRYRLARFWKEFRSIGNQQQGASRRRCF